MSYILDALEKSQRERGGAQAPSLDNIDSGQWNRPVRAGSSYRPRYRVFLTMGLALLFFGAIFILFYKPADTPSSADVERTTIAPLVSAPAQTAAIQLELSNELVRPATPQIEAKIHPEEIEGVLFLQGNLSASRLFYSGAAYRVGDELETGVRVLDIGPDYVEVSSPAGASTHYF